MSNAQHTPGPWELRPDDMGGLSSSAIAMDAYDMADAMLKARGQA